MPRRASARAVSDRTAPAAAPQRFAPLPPLNFPDILPVSQRREEIARAIAANPVVIVCGETGSGKTTQLPKICALAGRGQRGRIGHTQPRRLAATTVARRIAQELGSPLGEHVGFKIRFADQIAPTARIKLMTDGVLLAETQSDPLLRAYDTVIIDEAHERSLNIDFLLGYLKQLIEGPRRADLKLVVTSATIDAERLARHFGSVDAPAPVLEVSGRTYPVEIRYRPLADDEDIDLPEAIEAAIGECWRERPGDVLVFLPGEREIRETQEHLSRAFAAQSGRASGGRAATSPGGAGPSGPVELLALYSRLSATEQERVFAPGNGRRVVLATNVAETSLTVPGIRYVVDPGTARVKRHRYRNRVEQLLVEPISQASANQRAGRCGRTADGVCIRLYSEEDFGKRAAFTDPEVLRSSLASVILRMKALGLTEIESFPFIDPPPRRAIADGRAQLEELAATDANGALTDIGRKLARLPLDPRIGRMLLAAREAGTLGEALVIAAALSVQDPRDRPLDAQQAADEAHRRFADERSDFIVWLKLWRHWRTLRGQRESGELSNRALEQQLRKQFLSPRRLREWGEVHAQLAAQLAEMHWRATEPGDDAIPQPTDTVRYAALHRPLLTGLLGSIGMRDPEDTYYQGAHGTRFWLHPGSATTKKPPKWLIAAELTETTRLFARTVARVEPQWIEELGAHLIRRSHSEPHWEKRAGQIVAIERGTLHGLTIYAQRRVHFATREPALAREMLIRHALVDGDWESKLKFFTHNRKLIAEVERLEHKIRRPDLLVDDSFLFAFYDAAIPAHVSTAAQLEAWYREASRADPALLELTRDALLRKQAGDITSEQFPRTLTMQGIDFALDYLHEPGAARDGVTMTVPLYALNQVDARRCEWLVPGMLADKIAALVKGLPPRPRHRCQPVAEFSQRFAQTHGARAADDALLPVLLEAVREQAQLPVQLTDFRGDSVPVHLQMRFAVVDEHGRELASGRDLAPLREQFSAQATQRFREQIGAARADARAAQSARAEPNPLAEERPGDSSAAIVRSQAQAVPEFGARYTDWSFGTLPELLELTRVVDGTPQTLFGYPAVCDAGDAVRIEVFDEIAPAQVAHREGLARLFALRLKEPLRQAGKSLPDAQRVAMLYTPFGSAEQLVWQIQRAAIERGCLADPLPADATAFAERVAQARPRIGLVCAELARIVLAILTEHAAVQRKLKDMKNFTAAVADVETQSQALLPRDFVTQTPVNRLGHLARYLKAAAMRLDKLRTDAARDAARSAELAPVLANLRRLVVARKGRLTGQAEEFRWLVEELRVSLFAQELRTPSPVSVKRLNKLWEQLNH